jgi:amidohydrolase
MLTPQPPRAGASPPGTRGSDEGAPEGGAVPDERDPDRSAAVVEIGADDDLLHDAVVLYRDLHAHPELAFEEHRTAALVAGRFGDLGWSVRTGVGGTGVVALLDRGPGPVVVLRAELDALPLREETGLDWASCRRGGPAGESPAMHACGHDLHLAALVAACGALSRCRGWTGTVVAVAQPAEEIGQGARAMLDDGLLDLFPRPDVVLAQHVSAVAPAGVVAHCPGPALASADTLSVVLPGTGGHAASAWASADPTVTVAALVLRLQAVAAREVPPAAPATVTVGAVHAGPGDVHGPGRWPSASIPDEARIEVTVRAADPRLRERLLAAVSRVAHAECAAAGAPSPPRIESVLSVPPVVNDPASTARVAAAHRLTFGASAVLRIPTGLAAEDAGLLADAAGAPGVYWYVGAVAPEVFVQAVRSGGMDRIPPAHTARYIPDVENALPAAVAALLGAAGSWLGLRARPPGSGRGELAKLPARLAD